MKIKIGIFILLFICIGCANGKTTYIIKPELLFDFEKETPFFEYSDIGLDENTGCASEGFKSKGCFKIEYDHRNTEQRGSFSAFVIPLDSPLNNALGYSFMAKGTVGENLLLRIIDCNDEIYQTMIPVEKEGWNKYEIFFEDITNIWGGDGNNKQDYPLKFICIGVHNGLYQTGEISYDDFYTIPKGVRPLSDKLREEAEERVDFKLETNKPGNLFYYGEKTTGKIVTKYDILPPFKVEFSLEFRDVYGKEIKSKTDNEVFYSDKPKTINLPNERGYVKVIWTAKYLGKTREGTFTYGVIPDNSKIMGGEKSYFGVNTHFNQSWDPMFGKIVKRAGISWLRDGEARLDYDHAILVAKENGLEYMPTFTGAMAGQSLNYINEEVKNGKKAEDLWDFTPYIGNFGEYAKRYGDYIRIYDILNEPNGNGWLVLGGDWSGGPYIDTFMQWAKQVSAEIRREDKDCRVLWEDAEGYNWSDQYVAAGLNKEIDIISNHSYNSHRSVPYPEHNYGFSRLEYAKERNKKAGVDWSIIVGEIGYPTYVETEQTLATDMYPAVSEDVQAAQTVRCHFLYLSGGAEKIFLYDLKNDGFNKNNCEHEFGLTDYYGNPKPAMVAVSVLINQIEGALLTGREDGGDEDTYVFGYVKRDGKKCKACWSLKEKDIVLETGKDEILLMDLYGKESKIKSQNGKITVKGSLYPVYLIDF
ncbi:MAG: hypothetical protein IJS60_00035 [Abditibacteriota bacterium]|nr:hypothetical protein [Abditibacteriota bacterium]